MTTPELHFQPPFLPYGDEGVYWRTEFERVIRDYNAWQIAGFPSGNAAKILAQIEYARQVVAPNVYEDNSNAAALAACAAMKAWAEAKS